MCYYLLFDSEVPLKEMGILLSAWDSPHGELQMAASRGLPWSVSLWVSWVPNLMVFSLFLFVLLLGSITGGDTLSFLVIALGNSSQFLWWNFPSWFLLDISNMPLIWWVPFLLLFVLWLGSLTKGILCSTGDSLHRELQLIASTRLPQSIPAGCFEHLIWCCFALLFLFPLHLACYILNKPTHSKQNGWLQQVIL